MRGLAWVRGVLIGGLAVAVLVAAPLEAQRGPPGRRGQGQNRAQMEQRIRARMGQMIQERLGLAEEQSARLGEAVQDFDAQRRELAGWGQATRRRVEALMLEGGEDEAEARELLARLAEIKVREAELFQAEQTRLLEVLSPVQVLQFQTMREQIGQRIRALRRGREEQGPRGVANRRPGGDEAGARPAGQSRMPGAGHAPWLPHESR